MKVHPLWAELFLAGRQTDRNDEANSRFFAVSRTCPKWLLKLLGYYSTTRNSAEVSSEEYATFKDWEKRDVQLNARNTLVFFYFLSVALQPNSVLGRRILEVHRSHTIRHTHLVGPLKEWSLRRRDRWRDAQQTQETTIHVLSEIRTGDPSSRATSDPRDSPSDVGTAFFCYIKGITISNLTLQNTVNWASKL